MKNNTMKTKTILTGIAAAVLVGGMLMSSAQAAVFTDNFNTYGPTEPVFPA